MGDQGTYTFNAWTGPSGVNQIAGICRDNGLPVWREGTERVWFRLKADNRESARAWLQGRLDSVFPHAGFRVD